MEHRVSVSAGRHAPAGPDAASPPATPAYIGSHVPAGAGRRPPASSTVGTVVDAGTAGTFSFVRGNLSKLLALPRYAAGAVHARFVRRDPGLWVIASHFGLRDGAWRFFQAARSADPGLRLVWLTSTPDQADQARELGVAWCPRDSAEGYRLTLRAGVIVLTHGFGDANRYAQSGAVIVQLWHGSPLKKLHADSPATLRLGPLGRIPGASALIAAMYRRGNSRISLLPVAAAVFVGSMCTAFTLTPAQVRPLGEPRTDPLFSGTPAGRRAAARARLERAAGPLGERRVILYAPTWRDGEPDPSVPTAAQWAALEAYLAEVDAVLLVRPHPLGVGAYDHTSERVRLLSQAAEPESMPLLWGVDQVVTDYSSIVFDFAVTGGAVFFLAPDLEHYAATRGLYLDYAEITGGSWGRTWDDVLAALRAHDANPDERERRHAHSAWIAATFHDHHDGRNAERVVAAVRELAGRGRARAGTAPAGSAGRGRARRHP